MKTLIILSLFFIGCTQEPKEETWPLNTYDIMAIYHKGYLQGAINAASGYSEEQWRLDSTAMVNTWKQW